MDMMVAEEARASADGRRDDELHEVNGSMEGTAMFDPDNKFQTSIAAWRST